MHVFSYVVEQLVIFLYVLILLMEQLVFFFFWPKIPLENPECLCTAFSPSKLYFFGLNLTADNRKTRKTVV